MLDMLIPIIDGIIVMIMIFPCTIVFLTLAKANQYPDLLKCNDHSPLKNESHYISLKHDSICTWFFRKHSECSLSSILTDRFVGEF